MAGSRTTPAYLLIFDSNLDVSSNIISIWFIFLLYASTTLAFASLDISLILISSSTYNLYPSLVGILPEDVCVLAISPLSSRSAIVFLIVAEETPILYFFSRVLDPTLSPNSR